MVQWVNPLPVTLATHTGLRYSASDPVPWQCSWEHSWRWPKHLGLWTPLETSSWKIICLSLSLFCSPLLSVTVPLTEPLIKSMTMPWQRGHRVVQKGTLHHPSLSFSQAELWRHPLVYECGSRLALALYPLYHQFFPLNVILLPVGTMAPTSYDFM